MNELIICCCYNLALRTPSGACHTRRRRSCYNEHFTMQQNKSAIALVSYKNKLQNKQT